MRIQKQCIIHEYLPIKKEPELTYIDSGMEFGVYKCKCSVCGKKKEKISHSTK